MSSKTIINKIQDRVSREFGHIQEVSSTIDTVVNYLDGPTKNLPAAIRALDELSDVLKAESEMVQAEALFIEPKLTGRQLAIIAFVHEYTTKKQYSPCYREIMEATGITSTGVMFQNLKRLIKLGIVKKETGKIRTIRLV